MQSAEKSALISVLICGLSFGLGFVLELAREFVCTTSAMFTSPQHAIRALGLIRPRLVFRVFRVSVQPPERCGGSTSPFLTFHDSVTLARAWLSSGVFWGRFWRHSGCRP